MSGMSSKFFSKITRKFLGGKKVRMEEKEAGPNPGAQFREVGQVPEDASGFQGNRQATFK